MRIRQEYNRRSNNRGAAHTTLTSNNIERHEELPRVVDCCSPHILFSDQTYPRKKHSDSTHEKY